MKPPLCVSVGETAQAPARKASAARTPSARRRFGRTLLLGCAGFALALLVWEIFARSGMFSKALTPPLKLIALRLIQMVSEGEIFKHAGMTLMRMLAGLAIAFVVAVPFGMLMGTSRTTERMFSPLLSVLMPIPSLAWVPLFVLWFGLGNLATILVVIYASVFTLIFNTWVGVRAINPVWTKAAAVMGASRSQAMAKVVFPGTMPYIISGLRIAFGRAWIAVIGGELLASPEFGLGKIIFDAREFLDTESMLAALVLVGLIGIAVEKLVLRRLERSTIERWGTSHDSTG
ncbi:MAG: ABC transporter permease [Ideonella sp.]